MRLVLAMAVTLIAGVVSSSARAAPPTPRPRFECLIKGSFGSSHGSEDTVVVSRAQRKAEVLFREYSPNGTGRQYRAQLEASDAALTGAQLTLQKEDHADDGKPFWIDVLTLTLPKRSPLVRVVAHEVSVGVDCRWVR